ncbi:transporter [Noviherbaspirillum massiliense]|uniref:transporter n=1 Tax=Noviherbaspirillum massiliense TaxID=1465823 RepID=UPI00037598BC|nr:transporter [Noviherbaspirillum massiliense]
MIRMPSWRLPFLTLCLLSPCAHGAHPLVTEDSGTQDKGNHQIELNTDWAGTSSDRTGKAGFTYTYGVTRELDALVNMPVGISGPSGLNDLSVGLKWRALENGPASFAIKPELLLPSGNENKGLGNGRTSAALTFVASYETGPWQWHGNIAATVNRFGLQEDREANRRVIWRASTAIIYALGEHWKWLLDTGLAQDPAKASSAHPGYIVTGGIYSPREDLDLDAGIRFGLPCSKCTEQPGHQVGVGLTWRF